MHAKITMGNRMGCAMIASARMRERERVRARESNIEKEAEKNRKGEKTE